MTRAMARLFKFSTSDAAPDLTASTKAGRDSKTASTNSEPSFGLVIHGFTGRDRQQAEVRRLSRVLAPHQNDEFSVLTIVRIELVGNAGWDENRLTLVKDSLDAIDFSTKTTSRHDNCSIEVVYLISWLRVDMHARF